MVQDNHISQTEEASARLTSHHKELIAEVKTKLQSIQHLATSDFLLVAALLKDLRDRSKLNHTIDLGIEVSHIVTELQYIDSLKQRIDHMDFFLDEINGENVSEVAFENHYKTCGLIFQLNFFQLKIAKSYFIKSVEKIKSGLIAIKLQPAVGSHLEVEPDHLFSHFNEVIKTMHDAAYNFIHLSACFPVNSGVRSLSIIKHLLNRYTMESERAVLRWCMNYIEDNSIEELKIDDLEKEQIQLF
jgi:hypothetical protein